MQGIKVSALAVGLTFVWAMVVALVFRFPFPFSGYDSGVNAMLNAPLAVLLYGVLYGGLLAPIVLALLTLGLGNVWSFGLSPGAWTWIAANAGALVSVMALATLDYAIPNW